MDKKKLSMIDIKAPIVPWEGMGGIKLYSTIREMKEILEDRENVSGVLLHNLWVRYEIKDTMSLFFHLANGKLFKITALKKYKGTLFDKIRIGTSERSLLKIDPSFVYDDFEEVFESEKGAFIVTDPITKKAMWISVYIKELDDDDFEEGNW